MHLVNLFNKITNLYPNYTALRYGTETQTYSELDISSNALVSLLCQNNIQSGDRVGLFFKDPLLFINAMLALVKLNAIYVPFDNKDSFENISNLCQVADVTFFLHDLDFIDPLLSSYSLLKIERQDFHNQEMLLPLNTIDYTSNPVLYIMFTSSTTGKAKGVLINHAGISRFIQEKNLIKIFPSDSILQASSISFDASSFEIWTSLLNGATLVLIEDDFDYLYLGFYLSKYNITVLWLTTKLFETMILVNSQIFEKLKYLIFGGEACTFSHIITAFKNLPHVTLINGYGPTENTIFTTTHRVSENDENRGFIPIGFPVNDTECYVLDEQLNKVAHGQTGILYVAGEGLARSYTDQVLTDTHFINHSILGRRLYNTKDIVRYSDEFGFEYIGRTDRQVKMNGYRIELDLIENTVNQLQNILHSIAIYNPSKYTDELVLFYTTKNNQPIEVDVIKTYLEVHLPWYSIPKNIHFTEELPLNKSNKVDQNKLIDSLNKYNKTDKIATNEIETIWKEVLQIDSIKPTDNFFEIGGDSLSSLVLIFKINTALHLNLKTSYVIENPVFKYFESNLFKKDHSKNEIVLLKDGQLDCPIFLIPELGTGSERYYSLVKNLKTKQSVFSFNKQFDFDYGLNNFYIINAKLIEKVAKLFANHIVKSEISQKIILAGYSIGGNIAIEISVELKKYNIEVAQIHLLDSYKFGNTVYTNLSELRFKFGYFKRILTLFTSGIINRNVTKFKQLKYFIPQNEINSQYIKNIPVYLYKCLSRPSIKFIHPESLDWNSIIEQLEIIDINSKHDNMMKEGNVEELAAKMDESIDSLLNELGFQIKQFEELSKAELDYYLSTGWFRLRFGNHMFTHTKAPFENKHFPIKWLRYKLDASFLSKSIKKNNRFNQCKKFTPLLSDFKYENEKDEIEPLYTKYRSNIDFDAYTSVYSAVHHANAASSIFNTKIIKLYDHDKLIGVAIFDIGEKSGAGILYFYNHDYARYGIGKYLVLLILEYLVTHDYFYFYSGSIFIGHPKLDYKLSVEKSGIEYYDPKLDQWLLYFK